MDPRIPAEARSLPALEHLWSRHGGGLRRQVQTNLRELPWLVRRARSAAYTHQQTTNQPLYPVVDSPCGPKARSKPPFSGEPDQHGQRCSGFDDRGGALPLGPTVVEFGVRMRCITSQGPPTT